MRWRWILVVIVVSSVFSRAAPIQMKEGDSVVVAGRAARVVRYDVLPYIETSFSRVCVYDRYDNPKLAELRTKYNLEKVVSEGDTELEKQSLLMAWAHRAFEFGDPTAPVGDAPANYAGLRNALQILELAKKEHKFFCVQYASLLVSASASLGWICRPLGHSTHTWTEMWSNQYGRWVHFDPTGNYYWVKGDVPIDTYTAQRCLLSGAKDLAVIVGGKKTDREIRKYAAYSYIPNTNWLDAGPAYGKAYRLTVPQTASLPEGEDPGKEVLFPLNQAALSCEEHPEGLEVRIRTMTPNFKTFLVRVDGKEWQEQGERCVWKLHGGKNTLEAKSVNLFGVEGYPSTVVLEVK